MAGPSTASSSAILRTSSWKGSTRFSRKDWRPALSMLSLLVCLFGSSVTARLLGSDGVLRAGSAADLHRVPHLGEGLLAVLVVLRHAGEQRGVLGQQFLHRLDSVVPRLLLLGVDVLVV